MKLEFAAITDIGRRRSSNEDSHFADPALGLFAVADGMGGHAAGEVASAMAVERLRRESRPPPTAADAWDDWLRSLVLEANEAILERGRREPEKAGMGTTLTVLSVAPGSSDYRVAHVGDSRAYKLRAGRFEQLTRDHTWVQTQVDSGALTAAQARIHPLSSVLTRSLGIEDSIPVDLSAGRLHSGDLFLLCSDGLSGMVADEELAAMLRQEAPLAELASQLVEAANLRGGTDNITAVLIRAEA